MMNEKLMTAAGWCRELNTSILDPDGWRYEDGAVDFFHTPISLIDFNKKIALCTIKKGFEQ